MAEVFISSEINIDDFDTTDYRDKRQTAYVRRDCDHQAIIAIV